MTIAASDLKGFRSQAIDQLEKLKNEYLNLVRSRDEKAADRIKNLERAVRLLPGLLKTEEDLRSSVALEEGKEKLEESLEPLFAVLRRVLGSEFDRKRPQILAALEAELNSHGA